jgi:hypothetical protein
MKMLEKMSRTMVHMVSFDAGKAGRIRPVAQ